MTTPRRRLLIVAAPLVAGALALTLLAPTSARSATPPAAAVEVPEARSAPLPDAALAPAQAALAAYEQVRVLLAHDRLDGVPAAARELGAALARLVAALPAAHPAAAAGWGRQAEALAAAGSLDEARDHFATLSREVVRLVAGEPRLQPALSLFRCPMTHGFDRWLQATPTLANPYMGQAMTTCGSPVPWSAAAGATSAPTATVPAGDLAFYTCAMHPTVRQQTPGHCPICAMDLIAVTKAQVASGEIIVDAARQQQLGIRTALVAKGVLRPVVRALGRVAYDESAQVDVTLKVGGWVTRLDANAIGMRVAQGQPLLSLYSPELYAAEQDYLLARQGRAADDGLVRAARRRLSLWDVDEARIAALEQAGAAAKDTVITAPAGGWLIAKDVVQGAAVTPGQRLFRIAPTTRVWVLADILASDLPLVQEGQAATVALSFVPGAAFAGTVDHLYPGLDADTRSVRARVVIADPGERLRPDMFAEVTIAADLGERLLVPKAAVIYTGPRRLVFIDKGEGRLRPVVVTLGQADADAVEVLGGLQAGDRVVTSGTFLIAAESRIRSAEQFWGGGDDAR